MADLFAAAVNRHGGDAKVNRLPDIDIHGEFALPVCREEQSGGRQSVQKMAARKETRRAVGNNDALIGITPGILFRVRAFVFP